jgi:hypothetical protein
MNWHRNKIYTSLRPIDFTLNTSQRGQYVTKGNQA